MTLDVMEMKQSKRKPGKPAIPLPPQKRRKCAQKTSIPAWCFFSKNGQSPFLSKYLPFSLTESARLEDFYAHSTSMCARAMSKKMLVTFDRKFGGHFGVRDGTEETCRVIRVIVQWTIKRTNGMVQRLPSAMQLEIEQCYTQGHMTSYLCMDGVIHFQSMKLSLLHDPATKMGTVLRLIKVDRGTEIPYIRAPVVPKYRLEDVSDNECTAILETIKEECAQYKMEIYKIQRIVNPQLQSSYEANRGAVDSRLLGERTMLVLPKTSAATELILQRGIHPRLVFAPDDVTKHNIGGVACTPFLSRAESWLANNGRNTAFIMKAMVGHTVKSFTDSKIAASTIVDCIDSPSVYVLSDEGLCVPQFIMCLR